MAEIEEVDHTADWAIRIRATDARELFAAAAHGMFALVADPATVPREHEIAVQLEAADLETLLVDWLNELLFQSDSTGMLFPHTQIDALDIAASPRLRARARGGRGDGARRIKAATFAGLRIAPIAGGLEATIVFDV